MRRKRLDGSVSALSKGHLNQGTSLVKYTSSKDFPLMRHCLKFCSDWGFHSNKYIFQQTLKVCICFKQFSGREVEKTRWSDFIEE